MLYYVYYDWLWLKADYWYLVRQMYVRSCILYNIENLVFFSFLLANMPQKSPTEIHMFQFSKLANKFQIWSIHIPSLKENKNRN